VNAARSEGWRLNVKAAGKGRGGQHRRKGVPDTPKREIRFSLGLHARDMVRCLGYSSDEAVSRGRKKRWMSDEANFARDMTNPSLMEKKYILLHRNLSYFFRRNPIGSLWQSSERRDED